MKVSILIAAVAFLAACRSARCADFVPFVIPSTQNEKSLIAFPSRPIEPNAARLVARDGHFFLGGGPQAERVRVWGVNLCFAANFPTHADAERLAARLAAFGINSVRHHHMDSQAFPRGIWDPKDANRLSAEALDRLDYLIGQLARRGIYSNVNLHVSRTHSRYLKLADTTGLEDFDKMVDIFTPQLIEAQRKYARDLLAHVNPYRKMRLADDPAVAFVEINNEDSLFMWGWERKLRSLPEFYGKILQGLYNAWLVKRYESRDALAKAWSSGDLPLGENLLAGVKSLAAPGKEAPKTWCLELHPPCKATASPLAADANAVRVELAQVDDTYWHIQFKQFGLAVKGGQYYTVSFRARADTAREVSFGLSQQESPWGLLGVGQAVNVGPQWKAFRVGFTAKADEKNARLTFSLGQSAVAVELADVELRPGGREGLGKAEGPKAGTVALFGGGETDARTLDRMRFLAETEKAYFDGMREYVKKDLGCQAAVTGTIVFGPLGLWAQSDMDFLDGHAYWQHPHFPHKAWDAADWTIEQKAMVDNPDESTLYHLAAQRLAGKPYTVSEYNHPAPNDYQAECVPTIASFAAAQDWDGIWLFAYSHGGKWDREAFESFFDIDANPAKWGFVPAGAAIMRSTSEYASLSSRENCLLPFLEPNEDTLSGICKIHLRHGGDLAAAIQFPGLREDRISVRLAAGVGGMSSKNVDPPIFPWQWCALKEDANQHVLLAADYLSYRTLVGHLRTSSEFRCAKPDFAVLAEAALDGNSFLNAKRVLVIACGRCENTGMKFTADRRSVGQNWGKAPVQIEPVEGELDLSFAKEGKWTCHALKPDGTAGEELPITPAKGDEPPKITLSAKYGTMWYLLQRQTPEPRRIPPPSGGL